MVRTAPQSSPCEKERPMRSGFHVRLLARKGEGMHEHFEVVVWWVTIVVIVLMLLSRREHWRTTLSAVVSAYVVLIAVYVVLFTDIAHRAFEPAPLPVAAAIAAPAAAPFVALPIAEVPAAAPPRPPAVRDFDAVVREELQHRIDNGHYEDQHNSWLVRPSNAAQPANLVSGVHAGVW